MKQRLLRLKPAVTRRVLLLLAGIVWIGVGGMLLSLAIGWLRAPDALHPYLFAGVGTIAAVFIHHFGFLRVVDKNLDRILPMRGKRCAFAFMSWKSYLMVALMMTMGFALRHSPIPKPMLAVLYIGIGLALVLSSTRYLRTMLTSAAG
jgi:hypothetical protein